MKRTRFFRTVPFLVFLGLSSAASAGGRSLYRVGIDPDGAPVTEAVDSRA